MTVEEFAVFSAGRGRCELLEGEVYDLVPPGPIHGSVTSRLHYHVTHHTYQHGLGETYAAETGFVGRDGRTVRAPDVAFITKDRLPAEPEAPYGRTLPDLIAEVVSPSDRPGEVATKMRWWLEQGVKLVWIVEPESKTLTAYLPDGAARVYGVADTLTAEDVLPGFALDVSKIFE